MINWIQKTFNTDKWWGKTIVTVLTYVIYWCVFYGSWLIMPKYWFDKNSDFSGILFLIYLFILVPIISFLIPKFFRKTFKINKIFLYIFHVFMILLSIALFLFLGIIIAFSHFQIG
jgi:hypothetical protein